MTSRSQLPTGLHSVPGSGGAHPEYLTADGERVAQRDADMFGGTTRRNLNDQYKADMAAHVIWMANSRKQSAEFAETMRQIDADTAKVEIFLAESCEDCGQHVPSEGHSQRCIERAAERERCGYCGQDVCECASRYGVVQGIVSARAKGGR